MSKVRTLTALKKMDKKLARLFDDLDNMSEELLSVQQAGQWSALQILEHLKVTEQLSVNYIKYKISKGSKFSNTDWRSAIRSFLLNTRMRMPQKLKAPSVKGLSPTLAGLNYEEIKNTWIAERMALYSLLENLEDSFYKKNMYKHPAAGRLSLLQMLSFFDVHIERHKKQLYQRIGK